MNITQKDWENNYAKEYNKLVKTQEKVKADKKKFWAKLWSDFPKATVYSVMKSSGLSQATVNHYKKLQK